jgi:hypothetical protein
MKIFFNATFTDLGPFRAINIWQATLNMEDKTYGWTVEMQLGFKTKMSYVEILFAIKKKWVQKCQER